MMMQKRIPKDFYKLFRTKNMEAYMMFLVTIYEENSALYTTMGLTIEEGQAIIGETMSRAQIDWLEDEENEAEDMEVNQDKEDEADTICSGTPSAILRRLINWGWLKSDYDERLNTYILSYPEYSRLYVELFLKLQRQDDNSERESILSIYSALFTYHSDEEKNNEILRSALRTSKNLEQLLSNMQNGMRTYFDELSHSRNFMEVQQVLVEEINNSDSKRYAILTTSDSFYRYKEAVKELISQILNENEKHKAEIMTQIAQSQQGSTTYNRLEQARDYCEEAIILVYEVEREFDMIERKYNKLIEQKATFARRALARIRYIFQEGAQDENNILKLLHLLDTSPDKEMLLKQLSERIRLTVPYKVFDDNSMYKRRESADMEFRPIEVKEQEVQKSADIVDFVPRPLYTKKQIRDFRDRNLKNGVFTTTKETVENIEDLEKIMFLWQETTEKHNRENDVKLGSELTNEEGFSFSELVIDLSGV